MLQQKEKEKEMTHKKNYPPVRIRVMASGKKKKKNYPPLPIDGDSLQKSWTFSSYGNRLKSDLTSCVLSINIATQFLSHPIFAFFVLCYWINSCPLQCIILFLVQSQRLPLPSKKPNKLSEIWSSHKLT